MRAPEEPNHKLLHPAQEPSAAVDLPDYAGELAAYHRAYAPELREIIASLPLLDPASGNCLLNDPDLSMSCLNIVAWGTRPQ